MSEWDERKKAWVPERPIPRSDDIRDVVLAGTGHSHFQIQPLRRRSTWNRKSGRRLVLDSCEPSPIQSEPEDSDSIPSPAAWRWAKEICT